MDMPNIIVKNCGEFASGKTKVALPMISPIKLDEKLMTVFYEFTDRLPGCILFYKDWLVCFLFDKWKNKGRRNYGMCHIVDIKKKDANGDFQTEHSVWWHSRLGRTMKSVIREFKIRIRSYRNA